MAKKTNKGRSRPTKGSESRRNGVYSQLKSAIVQGELPANTPLREVEMATRLGVSRTPLREALFQLEREGFVCTTLARGFRVSELSEQEAIEIYPLIGMFEKYALENSKPLSATKIKQIRTVNRRLLNSKTRAERIEADTLLHESFTTGCINQKLQQLLQDLRAQSARYEWVYGEPETTERSYREHAKILDELEKGNQRKAATLLERHSVESIPKLLEFIRARQASKL